MTGAPVGYRTDLLIPCWLYVLRFRSWNFVIRSWKSHRKVMEFCPGDFVATLVRMTRIPDGMLTNEVRLRTALGWPPIQTLISVLVPC